MPKRSRIGTRDPDYHRSTFKVLRDIINTAADGSGKDPLAVALGRRGGLKGGKARAQKLSQAERIEIASKAAKTRWAAKRNV